LDPKADHLDDPKMVELLKAWGHTIGTDSEPDSEGRSAVEAKLFEPPAGFVQRLEELQAGETIPIENRERLRALWLRPPRSRTVLAIAAVIVVAIGVRLMMRAEPRENQGVQVAIADLYLSDSTTRLRSTPQTRFRSGDEVYLHFSADKEGTAFVAMLDSRMRLRPIRGAGPMPVRRGHNIVERPVRLDDETGTESFVILMTTEPASSEGFEGAVADAAATMDLSSHNGALQSALIHLKSKGRFSVASVTFLHEPR